MMKEEKLLLSLIERQLINMKDIIALLNCHNCPSLGELTSHRSLASTSFLGRYAFMDFAMSNFANSGIDTVGILVKDHQRSILKHMGNMTGWVNNTKLGRTTIFYNEQGILNEAYNTDINNIKENDWLLYDSEATTLVFASPHIVMNLDLRPYIEEHRLRKEAISVVYKHIKDADREFVGRNAYEIDEEGYLKEIRVNEGKKKVADVSLDLWIIERKTLAEMLNRHPRVDAANGIREMMIYFIKNNLKKVHAMPFAGYARCFDSLEHYVEYSFELLNPEVAKSLFNPSLPIFTLTHDTPPALYGSKAKVSNSFISNGCIIEGEVRDSIICRNVKVGVGSKIERSILLSEDAIGRAVELSNVVIDKYAIVTSHHTIKGDPKNIIYLRQGAML